MSSNLLAIAASGAKAAETALDLTGQNIANASTQGYVRRSANTVEIAPASSWSVANDVSLSGVTVSGIVRNADPFLQAEARSTASNAAGAKATVSGLTNVEIAVEDSGLFTAVGNFANAMTSLAQNPTNPSTRALVLQSGQAMAGAFQIAARGLSSSQTDLQGEIGDGVSQINTLTTQLASINTQLAASAGSAAISSSVTTSDRANLLDRRDSLLDQISQYANIATTLQPDGSANITLGGVSGPPLITGTTVNTLNASVNADGTETLKVGNATVALGGGSLAGRQAALVKLAQIGGDLDSLAASIATTVNTAQAQGSDLTGKPGAALFSGSSAATLAMTTSAPAAIATAAAGSPAGSADTTNLAALNGAIGTLDPAGTMNGILTDISGAVNTATTTQTTLDTLSSAAAASLSAQAGVNLNNEAVNLVQFQQAFQASGKVMQTASNLFTTIYNLH
jgi:flagellar hook-associated protein 1 FlgK